MSRFLLWFGVLLIACVRASAGFALNRIDKFMSCFAIFDGSTHANLRKGQSRPKIRRAKFDAKFTLPSEAQSQKSHKKSRSNASASPPKHPRRRL